MSAHPQGPGLAFHRPQSSSASSLHGRRVRATSYFVAFDEAESVTPIYRLEIMSDKIIDKIVHEATAYRQARLTILLAREERSRPCECKTITRASV
jgi:hypothetical protein